MSESSQKSLWPLALAIIGCFAAFAIILTIAYLPKRPEPLPEGTKTPAERVALLAELRANEQHQSTSYGWVDQSKGVVRLPIDRAIELTIAEANAKK